MTSILSSNHCACISLGKQSIRSLYFNFDLGVKSETNRNIHNLVLSGSRMAPYRGTLCSVIGCPNRRHPKGEDEMGGDIERSDEESQLKRLYPRTFHV